MNQFVLSIIALLIITQGCAPKPTLPVRPLPKAAFTWVNSGSGAIQFTNQSTEADTYAWNFGDSSAVSTDVNPKRTFAKNAKYSVSLTANNLTGSHKATNEVEVSSVPVPAPVANFTTVDSGEGMVTFANLSTNAQTYSWDFGNGITSIAQEPDIVKYVEDRIYTVKLSASGKRGSSSISKELVIKNLKPAVDFSWAETNGAVTFLNKTKNADRFS